jgi:hypothetical protein
MQVYDSCVAGPVQNSPSSELADEPVIQSEVDVAALAAGMPGELQRQQQQQQDGGGQQQQQRHEDAPGRQRDEQ